MKINRFFRQDRTHTGSVNPENRVVLGKLTCLTFMSDKTLVKVV